MALCGSCHYRVLIGLALVICAVTENQGYRIVFPFNRTREFVERFLLTHFEHVGAMMRPARA